MKNFIYINYNIEVDKIYIKDNKKYFFINNEKIYIIEYDGDKEYLLKLFNISNYLYDNNIKVNTILFNNKKEIYTKKDKFYIVLMKENSIEEVSIDYLNKFNIDNDLNEFNIISEWCLEIDTLENELLEYNKEYPLIQKSINYFIGISENAIELLNNYKKLNNNSIGHKVTYNIYKDNILNNPFTFIKTNKMYDYSNYVKYKFIINELDYDELSNVIDSNSEIDNAFLFACLLYSNIYFDLLKNILLGYEKEEKIDFFIKRIKKYNEVLLFCKNRIKNVNEIKLVTWIC